MKDKTMAKKKSSQLSVISDQLAVSAKPYEVKAWAGLPQYCCAVCAFDTLREEVILEHVARHLIPAGDAPSVEAPQMDGDAVNAIGETFEIELTEVEDGSTNIK